MDTLSDEESVDEKEELFDEEEEQKEERDYNERNLEEEDKEGDHLVRVWKRKWLKRMNK